MDITFFLKYALATHASREQSLERKGHLSQKSTLHRGLVGNFESGVYPADALPLTC